MATRLGMITPSLNTVLEPVTYRLLRDLPDVTAHFSRVSVTHISLDESSGGQFAAEPMIEAARLLMDAKVDSICWNGTSGGWLGVEKDAALCAAISDAVGVPVTSATQAVTGLFREAGVTRFGLVTPYLNDVQQEIIAKYSAAGFECVSEAHLGRDDGFAYAAIADDTWGELIRKVAGGKPQAITTMCTNISGAPLAEPIERETGIPLVDSISASLWAALKLAGADPARILGWGKMFAGFKAAA
ncbi:MAG: Asp/Glu/hydantoin racemase [Rhodospirillaceae bacterium]|jgi:maleate isomerase|nr:Asp/Glu/hydantoin racemase [Rhodospirillaceae bacterium]MBT4426644.1 Asp/Glu/hydantoin racemase [Rhodospirillaceae bacterium]MBT5037744.1 Asp/Glu/hydantoin racemase [Rhodospirillaceae bacterium]MBT5675684.1 Asp/Glu/hydantoin racemase [Rhodospirillaceae bacterium]MBT7292197.1 Asp/Glu/hydantoin racemase [Rhodospirillaceae bacterium]